MVTEKDITPPPFSAPSYCRTSSGSSLLARLSFMKETKETRSPHEADDESAVFIPAPVTTIQQHKTRRRRGSLRKVALLGRGAQRDRRDGRALTIDTSHGPDLETVSSAIAAMERHNALGLRVADLARSAVSDGRLNQPAATTLPHAVSTTSTASTASTTAVTPILSHMDRDSELLNPYTSTTDEEDGLQIAPASMPPRNVISMPSGSESYFGCWGTIRRRRSFQQAKSPLSYSGISTNALPPADSDWDYAETEWWGWVVLTVTWFVFVVGMGSCLGIWFWAWDVGKTPYAPPELEDDPTLPIVGYYPALIILTGVMAWIWVVVAWVGMKYFRHAKISGD